MDFKFASKMFRLKINIHFLAVCVIDLFFVRKYINSLTDIISIVLSLSFYVQKVKEYDGMQTVDYILVVEF